MKQLVEFFARRDVKKVLDVGTGTGDFIPVLKKVFPGAAVTGTDVDRKSLKKAMELHPDVIFLEMGAEKLDFAAGTFDVAAISMALHHLKDVGQSLAEMKRVVRKGGWIVVSELFSDHLNPAQEVHKMFHHFRSYVDRLHGITHNETFKKGEIIDKVRESGVEICLNFEFNPGNNLLEEPGQLEMRINQLHEMVDSVSDRTEHAILWPKIDEFREKALEHGFVPAPRVVIAGLNR